MVRGDAGGGGGGAGIGLTWAAMGMAATRRQFPGTDQSTLEGWLSAVLEEIATGKTLNAWGAGDSSGAYFLDGSLPPERRRDMILNDLGMIDPEKYPPRDNAPVKRTTPQYV